VPAERLSKTEDATVGDVRFGGAGGRADRRSARLRDPARGGRQKLPRTGLAASADPHAVRERGES